MNTQKNIEGPNGEKAKKETLELINGYNPTKSKVDLVSPAEWSQISTFVRNSLRPMAYMAPNTLRPFMTAATRLAVWAHRQGLDLDLGYLFDPLMLEAFEVQQEAGVLNVVSYLTRLAEANNLHTPAASTGVPRPTYQRPYSTHEIQSLTAFAKAHSNLNRRISLLAILALGAGAGVVRQRMRGVGADAVHTHDDGSTYVRTITGCSKVTDGFVGILDEVCRARPEGQLIGAAQGDDLTTYATSWVKGRVGVPELNVDRLRATYICGLIEAHAPLLSIFEWSGVSNLESLDGYMPFCTKPSTSCTESVAQ